MKRTSLATTTLLVLATTAALWSQMPRVSSSNPATIPHYDPWKDRLAELEQRVDKLETAKQELEQKVATMEGLLGAPKEGWKRREFNGETYFLIPLGEPAPQP